MKKPNDQMRAVLDAHKAMGPLPIESLAPECARQIPLADRAAIAVYGQHITKKALAPLPLPLGKVEHKTIPGPGGDLLVRLYTPKGGAPEGGWPVLVYFHGGGWVVATLDTYDSSCRALCEGAKCIVMSVHYRQAPEHKWPAAKDDAFAAWEWACANAAGFGGNIANIAVAGESAGGNLAAVVSQMAMVRGAQLPLHQLLIYPVTDLAQGAESASANENADAKPLNKPMLDWFYNYYMPEGADRRNPEISPLHAVKFEGLPPATVILAEIDPLRSDGEAYAEKLYNAGVPVRLEIFRGVTHEFFGMGAVVAEAAEAVKIASQDLRDAFEHTGRFAASQAA
jgi:acetyl esterase